MASGNHDSPESCSSRGQGRLAALFPICLNSARICAAGSIIYPHAPSCWWLAAGQQPTGSAQWTVSITLAKNNPIGSPCGPCRSPLRSWRRAWARQTLLRILRIDIKYGKAVAGRCWICTDLHGTMKRGPIPCRTAGRQPAMPWRHVLPSPLVFPTWSCSNRCAALDESCDWTECSGDRRRRCSFPWRHRGSWQSAARNRGQLPAVVAACFQRSNSAMEHTLSG